MCICWIVICLNTRLFATRLVSLYTRLLSFQPAQPTCDTTRSASLRGQERRIIMADNSTMANALAVIAGFLNTGTSTPSNQAANQVKKT